MKTRWQRYAVAVILTAVALGTTLAFEQELQRTTFVLAFLAVSVTAWLGGFGPALLATVLSVLTIDYYIIPPRGAFTLASSTDLVSILAFTSVALLISYLTTKTRRNEAIALAHAAEVEQQAKLLQDQTAELEQQVEESQALQEELEQLNNELALTNEAFARNEMFLEQAQTSARVGSWEWDIAANKVTWSDEMFRVYGLEPGSIAVSFESFLAHVHPDDREMVQREVGSALENRATFEFDHRAVLPDDGVRWLNSRGHVVVDAGGAPVRMIGSGQDVTERRNDREEMARLYREAASARKEAEDANRAKTDFLASMSHELRTPLNAIAGYAELLDMEIHGPLTERQHEDVARMRRAQRHLQTLVEEVLSFARLEAGQVRFDLKDFRLHEVLAHLGELVEPQVLTKGLRYEYMGCDPTVTVHADRERVEQIVLNLLTNAVKFTERDGRIVLSAESDGDTVVIHVLDTGTGIPPEKLESVFQPFVQLVNRTERTSGGIGLGLAISREFARSMGGDITVTSVPGDGSAFSVRLPASAPSATLGSRPATSTEQPSQAEHSQPQRFSRS